MKIILHVGHGLKVPRRFRTKLQDGGVGTCVCSRQRDHSVDAGMHDRRLQKGFAAHADGTTRGMPGTVKALMRQAASYTGCAL